MQVIVLDGHLKSSLTAIRSLGKAGYQVVVGTERPFDMGRFSRYSAAAFVYPAPKHDQRGFLKALAAQLPRETKTPVLAFSDATHVSLYTAEALKDRILFPYVSADAFEIAFNKAATYSEAKLLGIPVVDTWILDNEEEVKRRSREFSYPIVVKPRRSIVWQDGKGVSGTASFHFSAAAVQATFAAIKTATGESPLIQRFVEGEEYGVELLVEHGEVIAETVHHRLRSLSPTGGASVLKETVDGTREVEQMRSDAYRLARALSWHGPLMVEFKVDTDTKTPLLMELNGRFWGSLPLAVHAGVDFPTRYVALLTGTLKPEGITRAQPNITSRHWLGDVQHLLRVLLARDPMRPLLYPTRKKSLRDFFRVPAGTKGDVWSISDPLPALLEPFVTIARKVWK